MYKHKILCFLEYEEDDDDEEDDEEKWKNGYFIQKIVKKLQPRPVEDDGEIFFADISDETMTITLYVCTVTIKSFSSVPIYLGTLFISIIRWD